jgi:hypothetical protein
MIDVDGVKKHRHNSEGKPIHHTDEGIKNFHKWFGDSKVTDEHGRPQVVYHGSNHKFDEFKKTQGTISTIFGSEKVDRDGHFFTPDKSMASTFGDNVTSHYIKSDNQADLTGGYNDDVHDKLSSVGVGSRFMHNSYPSDVWEHFDEPHNIGKYLQKAEYDGARIYEPKVGDSPSGISHVVFQPNQIKSAIGNNGNFSKGSNKLNESSIYE